MNRKFVQTYSISIEHIRISLSTHFWYSFKILLIPWYYVMENSLQPAELSCVFNRTIRRIICFIPKMQKHEILKVFVQDVSILYRHSQPTGTKIMKMNSRGDCRWKIRDSHSGGMKLKLGNSVPSIDFFAICDGIWFFDFLTCIVASIRCYIVKYRTRPAHFFHFPFVVCCSMFMCGFFHLPLFVKSFILFVLNASSFHHAQTFLSGIAFVFISANFFWLRKRQQQQPQQTNQRNFCSYFLRK